MEERAGFIVASIDARAKPSGGWEAFVDGGRRATGLDPAAWARDLEERGAGEIFLNSIDRDGSGQGYDTALIRHVCDAVSVPVVACGGVGRYEHFADAVLDGGAAAAAAANVFHFFELSYPHAKRSAIAAGVPMRRAWCSPAVMVISPVYR